MLLQQQERKRLLCLMPAVPIRLVCVCVCCRERTKLVYSMYSRMSGETVKSNLMQLGVHYFVLEDSWCTRRTRYDTHTDKHKRLRERLIIPKALELSHEQTTVAELHIHRMNNHLHTHHHRPRPSLHLSL